MNKDETTRDRRSIQQIEFDLRCKTRKKIESIEAKLSQWRRTAFCLFFLSLLFVVVQAWRFDQSKAHHVKEINSCVATYEACVEDLADAHNKLDLFVVRFDDWLDENSELLRVCIGSDGDDE